MERTVEDHGQLKVEQVEIAMVTWHIPPLPTEPDQINWHRIQGVWKERHPLDGKSEQGGSLHIYVPAANELFGSGGLREVLPSSWYFDGGTMAHNPDSQEMTREDAKAMVLSLATRIKEQTATAVVTEPAK